MKESPDDQVEWITIRCNNDVCGSEMIPMTGPLSQYEGPCYQCKLNGRTGQMRVHHGTISRKEMDEFFRTL